MIRKIEQIGSPALRQIANVVAESDIPSNNIQSLIDDLIETMRDANGAGLAATQIAVPLRVCVIEVNKNPRYPYKPDIPLTVIINPKITFLTEKRINVYEGCLSVPNLRGQVDRCPEILVEGFDRNGRSLKFISKGISAGTFQHEFDHLDGLIFTDRMKDPSSLTTIDEFVANYEDDFKNQVINIVSLYGA
jgi:peptide deformylase